MEQYVLRIVIKICILKEQGRYRWKVKNTLQGSRNFRLWI